MYTSRYNFTWSKGEKYFVYNSLSNTFLKVNEFTYRLLQNSNTFFEEKCIPDELVSYLKSKKIIITEKNDDFLYLKRKVTYSRYFSQWLSLTIAPTTDCNYACPYCYEKDINTETMNKSTVFKICDYIQKSPNSKIRIDWYGGEPLLAYDTVRYVSKFAQENKEQLIISLITNGYLLTPDKVDVLKQLGLQQVQITLDGIFDKHDKTRKHKSGEKTFERTIKNISYILHNTDIFCNIRVNISKSNNQFTHVFDYFYKNFYGLKYRIAAGYIRDHSGLEPKNSSNGCNNGMSFNDKTEFLRMQYKNSNLNAYPRAYNIDCQARNPMSFVVAPSGDFFKCWEDIHDKNLRIFNINDIPNSYNVDLESRYLFAADVLSDEKCKNCNILPICMGGCPVSRMRANRKPEYKHDCSEYKNHIQEFLTISYENNKH